MFLCDTPRFEASGVNVDVAFIGANQPYSRIL